MPQILAATAIYKNKSYKVNRFLFSWWKMPATSADALRREVEGLLAGRIFRFVWTAEVLDDCRTNKYDWYLTILNEEKARVDQFFEDLRS